MSAIFKTIAAPPTPAAGYVVFYAKADSLLYFKDSTGAEFPVKPIGGGTGDLSSSGTVPLVADWDVGAFKITAAQLESDVISGTAPFIVASTTLVTNLNSEMVGGTTLAGIQTLIDTAVVGLFDDKGNYDASTNTPDLDTAPAGVKKGDVYTVSVAGVFFTATVEVGDVLRALQDNPTALGHWAIVQTNLDAPSVKTMYESNANTNAYTDAAVSTVAAAVVDGDFSAVEGFMRKTGVGAYEAVKSNLTAIVAPTINEDSGDGYAVGSMWVDVTGDKIYFCLDASVGAAVWQEVGAGGGGGSGVFGKYVTAADTAVAGQRTFVDSSTAYTINLPAAPVAGDLITFMHKSGSPSNLITIGRNGNTIDGVALDSSVSSNSKIGLFMWDGTAMTWRSFWSAPQLDSPSGSGLNPVFVSSAYSAIAGNLVFCDSSSAAFTVTLPSFPGDANRVRIVDAKGNASTNNITIARNGNTINGVAGDFIIDQNFGQFDGAYDDVAVTWKHALTGGTLTEAQVDARVALYAPASGTFTPVLWDNGLSDAKSQTYTIQTGHYRSIGDLVFFWLDVAVNSLGSLTGSDGAKIGGLPFTWHASHGNTAISSGFASSLAITAGNAVTGLVGPGVSYVALARWGQTTGTIALNITEFSAGGRIILSGQYIKA